jgi:dipeptidyl aminopeptidase/acylaminoacyl peptidase
MIDRERLGIGGHSYGAFSTANAMEHTPFFKAGIAGDGNYNRTLTPMRFQRESRVLMDAREVYINMSPILFANQMTRPTASRSSSPPRTWSSASTT